MNYEYFWAFATKLVEFVYRLMRILFIVFLLCVLIYVLRGCFYLAPEERNFIDKIEESFQATDENWIRVSDVTDFEWDTVCAFSYGSYPDAIMTYFSRYFLSRPFAKAAPEVFATKTGFDVSVFEKSIPRDGWFNYMGVHFFFKEGELVKRYVYTNWFTSIYNGQDSITFMGDYATGVIGANCYRRSNAIFYYNNNQDTFQPYTLVISDTKKIK